MIAQIFTPFRPAFSRCTFGLNYITESVCLCLSQPATSGHCKFSPFVLAKKLKFCQVTSRSVLDRFRQVPYSFHFLMLDLTELRRIGNIFVVISVLRVSWNSLVSSCSNRSRNMDEPETGSPTHRSSYTSWTELGPSL